MKPPAPALARVLPSGLKATAVIQLGYPLRVICSCPVAGSHSLTELSWLALARVLPSGLKARPNMGSACPERERRSFGDGSFSFFSCPPAGEERNASARAMSGRPRRNRLHMMLAPHLGETTSHN